MNTLQNWTYLEKEHLRILGQFSYLTSTFVYCTLFSGSLETASIAGKFYKGPLTLSQTGQSPL